MCILGDHGTLELLTTPLERLVAGQLGEAVRAAREAAGPGILDHAEAVLRGDAEPGLDSDFYGEVVVARALESGVVSSRDASQWDAWLTTETGQHDPRVQAFLSSCAEILDEYAVLLQERRQVVDRFVEARATAASFTWLGPDGELWFEFGGESYAALTEAEALEIVQREIGTTLHSQEPETLLRYSGLPDTGLEILVGIQGKPTELANSLLSGLIDLPAFAEDRVRAEGYAPFFRGDPPRSVEDLRFGEWVIIRIPVQS
ncbi:MAG: hypothetical protein KY464_03495 [Gemmatimonadetes bacterium]|nr:hypothetical protein [Gemmatimonadota bacterium]